MKSRPALEVRYIPTEGRIDLTPELLLPSGKIKLLSYKDYEQFIWDDFRAFCHFNARYGIPTKELITHLNSVINGRKAIEIGAGSGDLGHYLNILMTDSKIQSDPVINLHYQLANQPTIKYPEDVLKLEACEAVETLRPQVVIGSWLTTWAPVPSTFGSNPFGVKEWDILRQVETYILIGNKDIHGDKPLLQFPHEEFYSPFIVSRAKNQCNNRIYIWNFADIKKRAA